MGIDAKDIDVFRLLQQLRESNGAYPTELLANRRQGYLKQVAEITAGAGLAAALKTAAQGTQGAGAGVSSTAGTLLETLLVVAIVAEAGTVTYFYRDKFVELYNNISKSPKVEEVLVPPVNSSPIAEVMATATLVFTVTATGTPTITPSQVGEMPAGQSGSNDGGSVTMSSQESNPSGRPAVSTPEPNDNNGNHYGQTPIPARTKESDTHTNQPQDPQTKPKKNK